MRRQHWTRRPENAHILQAMHEKAKHTIAERRRRIAAQEAHDGAPPTAGSPSDSPKVPTLAEAYQVVSRGETATRLRVERAKLQEQLNALDLVLDMLRSA